MSSYPKSPLRSINSVIRVYRASCAHAHIFICIIDSALFKNVRTQEFSKQLMCFSTASGHGIHLIQWFLQFQMYRVSPTHTNCPLGYKNETRYSEVVGFHIQKNISSPLQQSSLSLSNCFHHEKWFCIQIRPAKWNGSKFCWAYSIWSFTTL